MLSIGGWRMYHEATCSPGVPWDCEKQCILWQMFDRQKQEMAGKDVPTYATLERRG